MNREDRDIDDLLRRDAERQLCEFDWDRLRGRIAGRLGRAAPPAALRTSAWSFRIASAAAVAAVVLVAVQFWRSEREPSLMEQIAAGRVDAGPLGPAPNGTDYLIADTSPRTVLLIGQTQLICSDPLLMPHSIWRQEPRPAAAARIKEKWQ